MRSNRWHLILVVGLLFGMLNALGIAALGEPGVLKMRLGYEIQSFDPGRFTLHETSIVLRQIYDNLVDFVPGNWPELRGQIAESYEASEDGLTYTFHIRKGIQWQRGYGELTAEDVKFSTERIMDPATESAFRSTWEATIDTVDVLDPYTVRFTLHNPDPAFLAKMAPWRAGPIVSKRAVEEFGEEYGRTVESTIGCGPFILKEYVRGQKAILEKFEGYYGDAPKVNRIEMYVIEDENTALLALQSGEIDMCYIRVPESVPIVTSDANLDVYKAPTATTKGFVSFNTQHPILGDLRVRQALVYALDRDSIAENVGGALAVPACGFLAQYAYWGALDCDELPLLPYDPDKARELLKAAGYPDGFEVTYTEINTKSHRALAPVLQAYWAEIGVETNIELLPVSEWSAKSHDGRAEITKYTMGTRPSEPSVFLYSNFHSSSTRPGLNYALYDGVDDLLEQAIVTVDDDKRLDLYAKIQVKIIEDCVVAPMFYEAQLLATSKCVDLGLGAKDGTMASPYWAFFWLEEISVNE
jgi:peptide/nickel transport system substrate-binding protein